MGQVFDKVACINSALRPQLSVALLFILSVNKTKKDSMLVEDILLDVMVGLLE